VSTDRIVFHLETPGGAITTRGFVWDGTPITVGRHESCRVRISGHHASRHHISFVRADGSWLVEDRSQNGTSVNGRRISSGTPQPIRHGDWLDVAGTRIRVEVPDGAPPRTVVLRSATGATTSAPGVTRSAPGVTRSTPVAAATALEVVDSSGVVREVALTEGCSITVGRDATCDVVIPDPTQVVSSLHAQVEWNWSGLVVLDHSTNGLFRNGAPVDVCDPLADGDVLTFAVPRPGSADTVIRVRRARDARVGAETASEEIESLLDTVGEAVDPPDPRPARADDGPGDEGSPVATAPRPAAAGSGLVGLAVGAIVVAATVVLGLAMVSLS
jgi:pSer/pThr/pTyr-binding forkhead associated (FHA) protein